MLRCCRACKSAEYFVYESGWSCEKHDFFYLTPKKNTATSIGRR